MNKTIKFLSGSFLLIVGLLLVSCEFNFYPANYETVYYKTFSQIPAEIDIESVTGDVYFEESNSDEIRVKILATEDNKHKVHFDREDGELKIETGKNTLKRNKYRSKIYVYLPDEYDGKINAEMITGDFSAEDLPNATANIEMTTGDVNLGKIETANIKIVTGDLKIYSVSKKVDIGVTTGDVTIQNATLQKDSKIKCTTGDVKIRNISDVKIESKTTTGDKKVNGSDNDSSVTLEIKVITGDIIVN